MRSNDEVRCDTTRQLKILPPARNVLVVGSGCFAPDALFESPVHRYAGSSQEGIDDSLVSSWNCSKLHVNGSRDNEWPLFHRGLKRALGLMVQRFIRVPQANQHVRVNRRHSSPRTSRIHRITAFFPDPMPGVPMPRNSSKTLPLRRPVITTLLPCL